MDEASQLIDKADKFVLLAEKVQSDQEPLPEEGRRQLVDELECLYRPWYHKALGLFAAFGRSDLQDKFMQEYEGDWKSHKIKAFFQLGWKVYALYDPEKTNSFLPKWAAGFEQSFKLPLNRQCDLLAALGSAPLTSQTNKDEQYWRETFCRLVREFIRRADAFEGTHGTVKKGLTYEHLAIVLVCAIEGLAIIEQDARGASEEHDLLVSNESEDSFLSRLGHLLIVECKNWSKPAGSAEVTLLDAKMDRKRAQTGILLSKNGITGDSYQDATALIREIYSKSGKYIIVLTQQDMIEIADGMSPMEKLRERLYAVIRL